MEGDVHGLRRQKLQPLTEPTRSFIAFYLLEDTTNSKYRSSNAINGKKKMIV